MNYVQSMECLLKRYAYIFLCLLCCVHSLATHTFRANLFSLFFSIKIVLKCKAYEELKQHIFLLMFVKSGNDYFVFAFIETGCYMPEALDR